MSGEGHLLAGRYRFQNRIGSGAMGVVWQAHDELLHRVVAIKQVLLPSQLEPGEAEEARERAMREGRIAARLQHPNAIAVYDVTVDNGEPCLVMEYLPSRSLAAVLADNGPLPPREVARIGSQVASALAAAHDAGIVHRDIKPGNILLGDNGTVKITDFGISRAKGDVTVTKTGMLAGTPAYLSPDVAIGREPTPASDVFSLGSTLYAAVEGQPPFGLDENTLALLHAVAAGKVNPPRQAGPLAGPLMNLLAVQPEHRPTMTQTSDVLDAVSTGQNLMGASPAAGFAIPYAPTMAQQTAMAPGGGPDGTTRALGSSPSLRNMPPQTRFDARPAPGGTWTGGQPVGPPSFPGGHPGGYQGGRPAGPYPEPPRKRRGRKALFTVLAVLAAAAIGIVGAIAYFGKSAPAAAHPPAAPATTLEPSTANDPNEPITNWSDVGQFVIDYYSDVVPKNLDKGFSMLTPRGQQASGGRSTFDAFFNQFRDTSAKNARVSQMSDGSVDVHCSVTYVEKSGAHKTEATTLHIVRKSGRYLIDSKIEGALG